MAATTRPFACLQCPYGANTHGNMMSHITNKHAPVKPFACTEHGCAKTCARADHLKNHVRDAHRRRLCRREKTGDAAIIRSIKAEADLTEVAVHPRAPPAAPAAPIAAAPLAAPLVAAAAPAAPVAALVAGPAAPADPLAASPVVPVAPVAPPGNIDWATVPGYYLYFGVPYGTGDPIPGGL
ncbi:hypothetical protein QM012_003881 [Aureobasidium pullulans]|uniref:C2H2-type domain-containing protein n=1 Tax=Aureobasidium pullulans TaxID=5580 RepID=A0ABR0T7N5_AURPU